MDPLCVQGGADASVSVSSESNDRFWPHHQGGTTSHSNSILVVRHFSRELNPEFALTVQCSDEGLDNLIDEMIALDSTSLLSLWRRESRQVLLVDHATWETTITAFHGDHWLALRLVLEPIATMVHQRRLEVVPASSTAISRAAELDSVEQFVFRRSAPTGAAVPDASSLSRASIEYITLASGQKRKQLE